MKRNGVSNKITKFLFLMNNNFQKIKNFTFIDLAAIEVISLDNNLIKVVEPMAFFSLYNLKYLSLNNNSIKTVYDYKFSSLTQFRIFSNNLSFIYETSFKNVSSLYLDYSSLIHFRDLNCEYFSMQSLYLGNQKIKKIKLLLVFLFFGLFSKLDLSFNLISSSLHYLILNSKSISLIGDHSFFNLRSLETLILSNKNINLENNTSVIFNALANIKLLNLSFNLIEFIGM